MISASTIDKIKAAARIDEVVADFVELKKSGSYLKGLCPFHDEKTPSFTVSENKNNYHCYGCHASGDAIAFVRAHQQLTFREALVYLADKYRIEIVEDGPGQDQSNNQEAALRESLLVINSFARKFFTDTLFNTEEGKRVGLKYLTQRGYSEATIRKFQLGYATDSWDHFSKTATGKGYTADHLVQSGLSSKKGAKLFDFFRERVQFPIHDQHGKIVGFAGRGLSDKKEVPKYINTRESAIYHKRKVLYGLSVARNAIRKEDQCILVEGYTDVIALSQAGIENVVASSGTALTADQLALVKTLTHEMTILFDGDGPGIKAAFRAIDLILQEDMNVKVVTLPPGEDPDSTLKRLNPSKFKQYLEDQAQNFVQFQSTHLLKDNHEDPVAQAKAIKAIMHTIARIPDELKVNRFIQYGSTLLKIDEQVLCSELNKLRGLQPKQRAKSKTTPAGQAQRVDRQPYSENTSLSLQELQVIRLLLEYGHKEISDGVTVAEAILEDLGDTQFESKLHNRIGREFTKGIESGQVPGTRFFLAHPDKEIAGVAKAILQDEYQLSENWQNKYGINIPDKALNYKKDIRSSICRYKLKKVTTLMDGVQQELKSTTDPRRTRELQEQLINYLGIKKQLADALGLVVLS